LPVELIPADIRDLYEVHEWKHATAILSADYPAEFSDIVRVLRTFRLRRSDALAPGGGRSRISQRLDRAFYERGWVEKAFATKVVVDDKEMLSPTHKVDCVKGRVALRWSGATRIRSLIAT
jgi:hypothetical protein